MNAIEQITPRTGHINLSEALLEQSRIASIRHVQSMQDEPLHLKALHQLQLDGWLWKKEPFRSCIQEYFNCEPEELKYRDYEKARTILSNSNIWRNYHCQGKEK
jgi:hypothetical protein